MTEVNRSAKRVPLNSCIRRVNRFITSRDKEKARSLCEDLTSKFDEFKSAHEEHIATLTKSKSIESAIGYFDIVCDEFDDVYNKLLTFLDEKFDKSWEYGNVDENVSSSIDTMNKYGAVKTSLITSKALSCTKKVQTIPQLELQAALLSTTIEHSQSKLNIENKDPDTLPHNHTVSEVIAKDVHKHCHLGRERISRTFRLNFWMIKARSLVYWIPSKCLTCKRLFSTTNTQGMANLPEARVDSGKPPYTNVYVDRFEPFLVKREHSELKRCVCVLYNDDMIIISLFNVKSCILLT